MLRIKSIYAGELVRYSTTSEVASIIKVFYKNEGLGQSAMFLTMFNFFLISRQEPSKMYIYILLLIIVYLLNIIIDMEISKKKLQGCKSIFEISYTNKNK